MHHTQRISQIWQATHSRPLAHLNRPHQIYLGTIVQHLAKASSSTAHVRAEMLTVHSTAWNGSSSIFLYFYIF
jgi:hypothetical protein